MLSNDHPVNDPGFPKAIHVIDASSITYGGFPTSRILQAGSVSPFHPKDCLLAVNEFLALRSFVPKDLNFQNQKVADVFVCL